MFSSPPPPKGLVVRSSAKTTKTASLMASRRDQPVVQGQFCLQNANGPLLVASRSDKASIKGGLRSAGAPMGAASAVAFTTRSAGAVGRKMLVIRPSGAGLAARTALPLASLSLAIPGGKKKAAAAAPAKKKSPKEILDKAAKSALRGGLPGMAAMAIQVRKTARRGGGWWGVQMRARARNQAKNFLFARVLDSIHPQRALVGL